jgi:hypothetical protein
MLFFFLNYIRDFIIDVILASEARTTISHFERLKELGCCVNDVFPHDMMLSFFEQTKVFAILGDPKTGKSSLSMAAALDNSKRGLTSLLIGNREKLNEDFPLQVFVSSVNEPSSQSKNMDPTLLQLIDVSYTNSVGSLLTILAGVQYFPRIPSLIIIEDIRDIIESSTDWDGFEHLHLLSVSLGHACDLIKVLGRLNPAIDIRLIITGSLMSAESLQVMHKYIDNIISLRREYLSGVAIYINEGREERLIGRANMIIGGGETAVEEGILLYFQPP